MEIEEVLHKDDLSKRELQAELYIWYCSARKVYHPWQYFWRHILGGVWQ